MSADALGRERARSLALRTLLASTVILLASGALGLVIRSSQAGYGRIDPNTWYALMTAHGLGAFLGWAGFAVMGMAYWVLAEVGFPLRRLGYALAEATFWLMVVGVAGVLVSTLLLHYAGSWVFLYPISFHSSGQWGEAANATFSLSVLAVGLSIVTWCVSILDTVTGPALHAVRTSFGNRLGVALGFGYLWPKRFATNPRSVPYAVIPLTVIAIDMIVATLPLAGLLIEMTVQAFDPSVTVDPLLAKNILWWFGHPVVYLLLFPTVAIYYFLVPRLAGRDLVAGNVIAVAWAIAVVANVFVWAHHVYIDYPEGSAQGWINTFMQPTTFALVIPSALSLYSLGFTIFRSNWRWGPVETALFLGLFSWLTAGLSGVINATIQFDVVVHNTLWIVGHFHQMALLNIGLVIFAAIYYFVPELTGRPLYSDALAKWHLWLTFVGATINSALWLVQGLEGAPRRYAVLPDRYDSLTKWALPFVAMIALGQVLFVWNMVQTLRGAERRPADRPLELIEGAVVLVGLALAAAGFGVGYAVARHRGSETPAPAKTTPAPATSTTTGATTTAATATASTSEAGGSAAGKQVFQTAGCAGCHTLKDADATGAVGPSLDATKPSVALVVDRVTNGKGGMPSFKGQLSSTQIQQVATYVSQAAGG